VRLAPIKDQVFFAPLVPTFELSVMAANRWSPNNILDIGAIDDDFRCVSLKKDGLKCTNKIRKDSRRRAREILQVMSTRDVTASDFHESLDDLSEVLLCIRDHRLKYRAEFMSKWEKAIKNSAEEKVQHGEDTVMGEAPSLTASILAETDDWTLLTELMERVYLARKGT